VTAEEKLDAVIRLAESLGVAVRYEAMGGAGGGLCEIRGKAIMFVDTDAPTRVAYERLLKALAEQFDLETVYLLPEIRRDLEYLQR